MTKKELIRRKRAAKEACKNAGIKIPMTYMLAFSSVMEGNEVVALSFINGRTSEIVNVYRPFDKPVVVVK